MWNSAGADVTLIMRGDIVLSRSDRRAAKILMRELKRQGITIVTNAAITAVDTGENLGVTVHYTDADGNGQEVFAEWRSQPSGVCRIPTAHVREASIELDENGLVKTDAYGRTSREHVWALGDITPGHQLAHRAYQQGYVVAENDCRTRSLPGGRIHDPNRCVLEPGIRLRRLHAARSQGRHRARRRNRNAHPGHVERAHADERGIRFSVGGEREEVRRSIG